MVRLPADCFVESDKLILKFIWTCKGLRQSNLEKKWNRTCCFQNLLQNNGNQGSVVLTCQCERIQFRTDPCVYATTKWLSNCTPEYLSHWSENSHKNPYTNIHSSWIPNSQNLEIIQMSFKELLYLKEYKNSEEC